MLALNGSKWTVARKPVRMRCLFDFISCAGGQGIRLYSCTDQYKGFIIYHNESRTWISHSLMATAVYAVDNMVTSDSFLITHAHQVGIGILGRFKS